MKLPTIRNVVPALLAGGLAACGSGAPGSGQINQVENDIGNPSGSIQDKSAVMASTGKQDALSSSGASDIIGSATNFGALTARGLTIHGFSGLSPASAFRGQVQHLIEIVTNRSSHGLSGSDSGDVGSCLKSQAFMDAEMKAAQNARGSDSFSFSYDSGNIDLSGCTQGKLTGQIQLALEEHASKSGNTVNATINFKYTLSNACNASTGNCVSGSLAAQMTGSGGASGDSTGSFTYVTAWDLTVHDMTLNQSIADKGGSKISISGNGQGNGQLDLQEVVYVQNSQSQEVSFTLDVNVSGSSASLKITGKDGFLTCTRNADLSGSCSGEDKNHGTVNVSWTGAEFSQLRQSDQFKK